MPRRPPPESTTAKPASPVNQAVPACVDPATCRFVIGPDYFFSRAVAREAGPRFEYDGTGKPIPVPTPVRRDRVECRTHEREWSRETMDTGEVVFAERMPEPVAEPARRSFFEDVIVSFERNIKSPFVWTMASIAALVIVAILAAYGR